MGIYLKPLQNGRKVYYGKISRGGRVIFQGRLSTNKRIAEEIFAKEIAKADRQQHGIAIKKSFSDMAADFIKHQTQTCQASSIRRDELAIRTFRAYFEGVLKFDLKKVHTFTIAQIEGYRGHRKNPPNIEGEELPAPVGNRTVNLELATIRNLYNRAIERKSADHNPIMEVDELTVEQRLPTWLTRPQLESAIAIARAKDENRASNVVDALADIMRVLAETGLRVGELEHLEWRDVDLSKRRLYVKSKAEHAVKTHAERSVPLTENVVAVFERLGEKRPNKGGTVFHIDQSNVLKRVKKVYRALKLKGFNTHSFRHTACCLFIEVGVPLPTVQKIMGHANIQTTMRYAHVADGQLDKAAALLSKGMQIEQQEGAVA